MTVPVNCYSHRLNEHAFVNLMSSSCHIQVSDITESSLFLRVENMFPDILVEDFAEYGHQSLSLMLIALNIATFGHFIWATHKTLVYPQYAMLNPTIDPAKKSPISIMTVKHDFTYPDRDRSDIQQSEVDHAKRFFSILVKEPDAIVRREYLKGIFHLGYAIHDTDFQKDAFGNFYRSFEYFVTERVLRVKKLNNEKKSILKALAELGLPDAVAEDFGELYEIRSEQVMHAQKTQRDIEWDDARKMKLILDFTMHQVYKPIIKLILEDPSKYFGV